jgi:hypothetical protein
MPDESTHRARPVEHRFITGKLPTGNFTALAPARVRRWGRIVARPTLAAPSRRSAALHTADPRGMSKCDCWNDSRLTQRFTLREKIPFRNVIGVACIRLHAPCATGCHDRARAAGFQAGNSTQIKLLRGIPRIGRHCSRRGTDLDRDRTMRRQFDIGRIADVLAQVAVVAYVEFHRLVAQACDAGG